MFQPKTGNPCSCKPGKQRDNCPHCEGTGQQIDFAAIRAQTVILTRKDYMAKREKDGEIIKPTEHDMKSELFSELWNLVNFLEATEKGYCAKELHAATLQRHLESAKAVMAKAQINQPSPGRQGKE